MDKQYLKITCVAIAMAVAVPAAGGVRPSTPDGAARRFVTAVRDNQPDVVFALLPASYQRDIENLVTAYAGGMDRDIWNRGRALSGRIASLLEAQGGMLAEHMVKEGNEEIDLKEAKASIAAFAAAIRLLAAGDITCLDRLRRGGVRELLATDGRQIMTRLHEGYAPGLQGGGIWNLAGQADRVSLVEQGEDRALVKLEPAGEAETLVLVEGAWVPEAMAGDAWRQGMDDAMRGAEDMDYSSPEGALRKAQVLMAMAAIENVIGQLEKAKSLEEMGSLVGGLGMMLMPGMMQGAPVEQEQ